MLQKTILFATITTLTVLFACTTKRNQAAAGPDSITVAQTGSYYTCPMHPSVRSDHPGACPVCGMALVKKVVGVPPTGAQAGIPGTVILSSTQMVLADVTTDTVRRQTMVKELSAVGVVSAAEPMEATIAARFRGRVEKLYANFTGATVKKGDPLFELYSPDITSAAQDYILALSAQRATTDESGPGTSAAREQLVDASRTRLLTHFGMTNGQIRRLAETRVPPSTIRFESPLSGTILSKNVQEGQYLDEGMVLYQLADLSKVWMNFDVYEENLQLIRLGQDVTITADAYPGEEFHGRVTFIDPTVNSDTRTVRVRTESPNQQQKLKPNMFVTAHIRIPVQNALVVPNSAILRTGLRNVVWVEVRPGTYQQRDVVIGLSTYDHSEIRAGLGPGDIVATSGGFLIDSESQLSASDASVPQHAGMKMDNTRTARATDAMPPDSTMNDMRPEHLRSDSDPVARPSDAETKHSQRSQVRDVEVLVEGSYSPDEIRTKVGQKLRLHFYRDEDSACTSEVVFDDFGIRKFLPPRDTVIVEITPNKAGTFDFHCGMGMLHGKIIVGK